MTLSPNISASVTILSLSAVIYSLVLSSDELELASLTNSNTADIASAVLKSSSLAASNLP